jgi:sugar O-acyltransferase (sialic acid O-acetyltransferase NeuD family)
VTILIYGAGDFGQVVKELVCDTLGGFAGFVDDWNTGEHIVGSLDAILPSLDPHSCQFVMAIGYRHLRSRWQAYQRLRALGFKFPSLIHPNAIVHNSSRVADGAIVMMGATVGVNVGVNALAVLWPGVVVAHDAHVGPNAFLSPSATVCGHSSIGRDCFIGAGATIVDHVAVPDGSFVKAGSAFHRRSAPVVYRISDRSP